MAKSKSVLGKWGELGNWSSHLANEVIRFIGADARVLWEQPRLDIVNVKNGLLDLNSGEVKPHTHVHYSAIQIPVEYDPDARCPAWEKFVSEVFPAGAEELAWEICGHLMIPDISMQKAFLLHGAGGNGKSTFLAGLTRLLGRDNISAVSLQDLVGGRFARAQLVGKLANICPDTPSRQLADTAVFKAITGGDAIEVERKFQTPFTARLYSRLVFSANQFPQGQDPSQGFFDRWVVIPFERVFRGVAGEVKRNELDGRLAHPRELSGVLNRALEALRRLRQTQRFT